MREEPKPFDIYRHFKGRYYQIMTVAEHTETGERFAVYMPLYGVGERKSFVRPIEMFLSEINSEKYPDIQQKYRFEKVSFSDEPIVRKTIEKNLDLDYMVESSLGLLDDDDDAVDVGLMEFLDADSYEKKMEILVKIRGRLDERTLNTMAVALDLEAIEGTVEQKYEDIKYCLMTLEKYECNRLR